jgi:hypothetical protein
MFFLQFEGTPPRLDPEWQGIGGAFISCWIERATLEEAEAVARSMIGQLRWIISEPDRACSVDREDYVHDPEGLEIFEQAIVDREVLVFDCYPDEEIGSESGE